MTDKRDKPELTKEERRYFRMDDTVQLAYRVIPDSELAEHLERQQTGEGDSFTVLGDLSSISRQMTTHMHQIESKHPDIAAYLRSLDKKIDHLAQTFLAQELDMGQEAVKQVNLSAGGMSLYGSESLEVGAVVELKLLLPPLTGILTYGEVVGCEKSTDAEPDSPYLLRVDFTYMQEPDRELLIRYMLRRQSKQLRERRDAQDSYSQD